MACGAVAVALLLSGCTGPGAARSPSPTSLIRCAGDQAASTYELNWNATPPLQINGATVSVSSIESDDQGPKATLTVVDAVQSVTTPNLRLGATATVGNKLMRVTHICVAEDLPSPMPPGSSRGTVGLANA